MFSRFPIVLAGTALLLAVSACSFNDIAEEAAAAKDNVAATVNGTPISESLVRLMLEQRTELGKAADAEARRNFIDRLALQVIISQEAVKKGLDKTPEVADRLALSRQSVLVDAFVQDYLKNSPVSDDALKAEYEKFKTRSSGTEYRASHILVDSEAEAKDIIAKLNKNPKAFAALAKQKSKDTGSGANGGELGWFDLHRMIPEFGDAVAKLAKGKFTEAPVKTQFGYHVILLEDTRAKQVPPFEQVKALLTRQVQQESLKTLFDELKAKAKIQIAQAPAQQAEPAAPAKK